MSEENENFKKGMELRGSMWGEAGVNRVQNVDDFNRPLEDLVTQYCFGDVWQRPGLSKKVRSMITLAALTALTKPNQIKAHVQGAIANGVSKEEIREIILHTSIYAGIPSGVEGMTAATETLARLGIEL